MKTRTSPLVTPVGEMGRANMKDQKYLLLLITDFPLPAEKKWEERERAN